MAVPRTASCLAVIFEIFLDQGRGRIRASDLRGLSARLIHTCAGRAASESETLTTLGRTAILAFLQAKGVTVADVSPEEITARESAEYDQVFHLLTETMEKFVEQKVSKIGMFPPIVDFVTTLGLMAGGEPVVRLMMARMEDRIGAFASTRLWCRKRRRAATR